MSDNNNNSSSNQQEQEWEHSDFSWEAMQPDIFQKMEKEDPSFFKKEKRRIVGFWIFGLVAVGLFICTSIVTTLSSDKNTSDSPIAKLNSTNDLLSSIVREPNTILENKLPVDDAINDNKNTLSKTDKPNYKTSSTNTNKASAAVSESNKTPFNNSNNPVSIIKIQPESTPSVFAKVDNADFEDNSLKESTLSNNNITTKFEEAVLTNQVRNLVLQALVHQPLKNDFSDLSPRGELKTPPKTKEAVKANWRLTAMGGGLLSSSKYKGNSEAVALRNDHTSPWFGWQYGMKVERNITKKVSIFAGIDRAVAFQSIDIETEREVDVDHENVLLNVTHFVVGARTEYEHGDTTVISVEHNRLVNYNELRSLQFNLGASSAFQINKRWSISPYAGFATNLISRQSGVTVFVNRATKTYDNDNPIFKRIQYKVLTGLNLEYALSKEIALSAVYRFDKQLNNGSLEEGMSWRPSHHFIGLGAVYGW